MTDMSDMNERDERAATSEIPESPQTTEMAATPAATISTAPPQYALKRHPIRGALWGILLGLGAALFLIGAKVVAFGTLPPVFVIVGGIAVGVLWSCFGPAKGPSGPVADQPAS